MTSPLPTLTMACGRLLTTDPTYVPSAEYRGETLYFCTSACLNAFLADPEKFLAVHPQESE